MTIEKSKIRRRKIGKQPLMKCCVGECLCYGEEEIAKARRNCLGDGYNHKVNKSEMVKALIVCCQI
jgi:hypothetical protein